MKINLILLQIVIAIMSAQMSFGQVTYEIEMTSDGYMGMGAFKTNTKTYLIKDAQRTETKTNFTGAFLKYASPKGTEVSIVRLDKNLIWNIDDATKTYNEQSFIESQGMMDQGNAFQSQTTYEQGEDYEWEKEWKKETPEQDEDFENEYEWKDPVVKVEKLKEDKIINGINCQHYIASVTTIGIHKETGLKDTLLFFSDIWNANDVSKSMELINDFNKRYMEAMGFQTSENQGLAMIAGMQKDQMQILNDEISNMTGYPIINDMKLTITNNSAPIEEEATEEESEEEEISVQGMKKKFGGLLGKKFQKKLKEKDKKKETSSATTMFHMKTEVKSIISGKIASEKFEVNKGYKLKN